MTLTELLVASIMIGIVMVGVAAFSVAIKNLQRSTNKTVLVALKTKAAMATISQDALVSIGDAQDRGVVAWTNGTDSSSICFRQDVTITPEDYTNDLWACYWHGPAYTLLRCLQPAGYLPGGGCSNQDLCCSGALTEEITIQLSDPTSDPIPGPFVIFAELVPPPPAIFEYIDIILTVRHIYNAPIHAIDNPEYTLSTQISPTPHSR